ncbi:MAG TPA: molybdenum cofactor biosynthesis protein B [Thermomicrobiales bacterium]|nr:molybdenum cofactor biosynthesis protein B [Thermomicrobiales bacterium]
MPELREQPRGQGDLGRRVLFARVGGEVAARSRRATDGYFCPAHGRMPVLLAPAEGDTGMSASESKLSPDLHREIAAEQIGQVAIAIVTVSDSRTPETDTNMQYLKPEIESLGHLVSGYMLIKDEPDQVEAVLNRFADSEARMILFNGGTGIAPRDTTYDVLARKIEKPMPGFGELFRMLSYEQVGAAAMLSRATAGVYRGKLVISTPGSNAAVRLAWEKLIAPELQHLAWEVVR